MRPFRNAPFLIIEQRCNPFIHLASRDEMVGYAYVSLHEFLETDARGSDHFEDDMKTKRAIGLEFCKSFSSELLILLIRLQPLEYISQGRRILEIIRNFMLVFEFILFKWLRELPNDLLQLLHRGILLHAQYQLSIQLRQLLGLHIEICKTHFHQILALRELPQKPEEIPSSMIKLK